MSGRVLEWAVQLDIPMSHATFRVLTVLAKHANDDGSRVFPALETIQAMAQAQRSTVARALANLERLGLISREKGGGRGKSTHYRINVTLHNTAETVASGYSSPPETVASSDPSKLANSSATLPFEAGNSSITRENSSVMLPDSIRTLSKKESTPVRPPADPQPARRKPASASRAGRNTTPKRGRIPRDWQPGEAARAVAAELGLDCAREGAEFRSFWLGKGGVSEDWQETFIARLYHRAEWRADRAKLPPRRETREEARNRKLGLCSAFGFDRDEEAHHGTTLAH